MSERFKNFRKKLNDKYRLIILNDITLEERFSFRLSRLNVFSTLSTLAVMLVVLTLFSIIYTPLRFYLPGLKGDMEFRRNLTEIADRTDSLSQVMHERGVYLADLQKTLRGEIDTVGEGIQPINTNSNTAPNLEELTNISKEDSLLRTEVEDEEQTSLSNFSESEATELSQLHFNKPVEGYITDKFDLKKGHYGVDIVGKKEAPVKAIMKGVVIFNDYSVNTGNVIAIQHDHNLVSFYKHNSEVLKKIGTLVQSGEVIAIIGNSGELSDGPHLHLELWYNQQPVDPLSFIIY